MIFHLGTGLLAIAILTTQSCSGRLPVQKAFPSNVDRAMPNLHLWAVNGYMQARIQLIKQCILLDISHSFMAGENSEVQQIRIYAKNSGHLDVDFIIMAIFNFQAISMPATLRTHITDKISQVVLPT